MLYTGQGYWQVKGMAASYDGYKTVSVNAEDDAPFSEVVELIKEKVRHAVARGGCWSPSAVEVSYVEVAEPLNGGW